MPITCDKHPVIPTYGRNEVFVLGPLSEFFPNSPNVHSKFAKSGHNSWRDMIIEYIGHAARRIDLS